MGWNLVFGPLHQTLGGRTLTFLYYVVTDCLQALLVPWLEIINAILWSVKPKRWRSYIRTWTRCGTCRLYPLATLATAQRLDRSFVPKSLRTFLYVTEHGCRLKGIILSGAWLVPICCGESTEPWFPFKYWFMQAWCIFYPLKFRY